MFRFTAPSVSIGFRFPALIAAVCGLASHEVSAQELELRVTEETIWVQGYDSKPKSLGVRASAGFCFLTMMRGKFEGRGEEIFVTIDDNRWVLGANTEQEGVAAGARCVVWGSDEGLRFTNEWKWEQGTRPISIRFPFMTRNEGFCYLSWIRGDFEGGGERIELSPEGDYWLLGGSSQQDGIAAGARCVEWPHRLVSIFDEHTWSQDRPQQRPITLPLGEDEGFCYLSMVKGKFHGGGEVVRVYISGRKWKLGGQSAQEDVGAKAGCVKFRE